MGNNTSSNKLNRTGAGVSSPSSGVRPGARAFTFELPTSFVVGLLSLLFGGLLLSHSAYAASYLNVSSSGAVSLGSIRPTSSGTSSTGSDTLTVHTDCSVGYSVYVSGQNGKDTNLTNESVSTNNTISTSSTAVGDTATALNSNTWGLNYENTGAYVGLPTYSDSTNKALTSKADVEEASTVPIYYGIKVDTSITPGTYTGDVLYTVLMDSSCLAYTVVFNSNGGSGTMDNQSIMAGTKTALDENTFTRDGYTFLGWSTKANGKTETAVDGVGTEADVDYADKAEVTDLTSGGSSITLYAIWEQDVETMQGWTGCSALATGQAVTLKDTRDNKRYAVKKLPDGKCWMMQNLTINGAALTPGDTNIDNGTTYYLPKDGGTGSITSASTANSASGYNFAADKSNQAIVKLRSKNNDYVNDSDTGYYNFYTATLGFSSYNDDMTSGTSTRDICPKGWRLPWTSDSGVTTDATADFFVLASSYNPNASWDNVPPSSSGSPSTSDQDIKNGIYVYPASPLNDASQNNYAGFSYRGGYWSSYGAYPSHVGSYGYYWSASVRNAKDGYSMYLVVSNVFPQYSSNKYYGLPVRCIAQDGYAIVYSSDDADSGEASKTSETVFQNNGAVNVVMPTAGTLAKDGYEFKGWALTSGATSATYQAEETVALPALLTAASSASQTTTPGSTITIYPFWEEKIINFTDVGVVSGETTMQEFNKATMCDPVAVNQYTTLKDARDDNTYVIKKLSDGNCWMAQNLRLVGPRTIKPSDSDVVSDFSLEAPYTRTWCTTANSDCEDTSMVYYVEAQANTPSSTSYYGALYNWYTATAGTGTSSIVIHTNAQSSICPKGWRLPTAEEDGDFFTLDKSWGGTGGNRDNANTYNQFVRAYSEEDGGGFSLGGIISGSSQSAVGSTGKYWSSTNYNTGYAYVLHVSNYSSNEQVYPQQNIYKYQGASVRCVSNDPRSLSDISYMQDINHSIMHNTTVGTYSQLTDLRDENVYYVKKLADNKLWMVENLKLVGPRVLTSDDSNITRGEYSIPAPTDSAWCTSAYSPCIDQSLVYYIPSDATNPTKASYFGALYNWYAATASFGTYYATSGRVKGDICPKGWRLPIGGNDTGLNDFSSLDISLGGTGRNRVSANTFAAYTGSFRDGGNGGFNLSGYIDGSPTSLGTEGRYWTAFSNNNPYSESLNIYSSTKSVRPTGDYDKKYEGLAVRCIAK